VARVLRQGFGSGSERDQGCFRASEKSLKKPVDRPQKSRYLYPMKKIIVVLLLSVSAQAANLDAAAFASGDFETLARCHNGGCGWRKNKSATDSYWKKIKKNL